MTDKDQEQKTTDPRPLYEPPRALSLSDLHTGTGGDGSVCAMGSSALECIVGSIAEFRRGGSASGGA